MPFSGTAPTKKNNSTVYIIDHKHLEDAVNNPKGSLCSKILSNGFFCKQLHRIYTLHISHESIMEICHMFKGEGEKSEEVEIENVMVRLIKEYIRPIETISASCYVQEALGSSERTVTEATLSLISKRKLDVETVKLISDGETLLAKKIKEKNVNIPTISQRAALEELESISDSAVSTL